jgi:hypothetical protein
VDGGHLEFASGYWASIAKLESERPAGILMTILDWLTGGFGLYGSEPRYRIVIGREGTERTVGVREARAERKARRDLAEVAAIITHASEDEVKAAFDLEF